MKRLFNNKRAIILLGVLFGFEGLLFVGLIIAFGANPKPNIIPVSGEMGAPTAFIFPPTWTPKPNTPTITASPTRTATPEPTQTPPPTETATPSSTPTDAYIWQPPLNPTKTRQKPADPEPIAATDAPTPVPTAPDVILPAPTAEVILPAPTVPLPPIVADTAVPAPPAENPVGDPPIEILEPMPPG